MPLLGFLYIGRMAQNDNVIARRSGLILFIGFLILSLPEIMKVYFIMPFPGSQHQDNVSLAYFINQYIWVSRILGGGLMLLSLIAVFRGDVLFKKVISIILVLVSASIIYLTTFVMLADKMFYQPETKLLKPMSDNRIDKARLVIGIELNGDHRAYPVELLAYHHQVRDTGGGTPVMVTYCSVCRTAMVFKPEVDGHPENFRLVGMDQFNAMFEDSATKSWWRQATGECCAGPLKGKKLQIITYRQMTLGAWQDLYPTTLVMQPDPKFKAEYDGLRGFDDGTKGGSLTGTDTVSLHPKSWVLVVSTDQGEKMYDWNELKKQKLINDKIANIPVVLVLDSDKRSYYVFKRNVKEHEPIFTFNKDQNTITDTLDASVWNMKGECIEGKQKGDKMEYINAYQEFYHTAKTFHPAASPFK